MKRHLSRYVILVCVLACTQTLPPTLSADVPPPGPPNTTSSLQKIREAHQAGLISAEEALLLQAAALFAPERLPQRFQSARLEKCGTPFLISLESQWWALPVWLRAALSEWPIAGAARGLLPTLSRPGLSGPEQTLATDHFLIHYTLSGADAVNPTDSDANGIPDYADATGHALETAHQIQVERLGWLAPPSDEPIDPEQAAYDVYIKNITVAGLTYPEAVKGDNENSPGIVERYARYSYITLHRDLAPEILQATAAHEYNHAIQFGYNAAFAGFDARRWFMEGTATWMEGQVYPDVRDNVSYIAPLFAHPDRSLAAPENYYASWLFFQHLEEHCGGPTTMRAMWEASVPWAGDFSVKAIRDALAPVGCTINDSLAAFCIANLLLLPCELTASPYCYEDALLYLTEIGSVTVEGHVMLRDIETTYVPHDGVQQFACDYVAVGTDASLIAAGGYNPLSWTTIQGIWLGKRAFTVCAQPFTLTSDPVPPSATVSPHEFDALYILAANLTDPTNSEIRDMHYGLTFSILNESTPTATPSPSPTLTPTARSSPTPMPEAHRIFLPVVWAR